MKKIIIILTFLVSNQMFSQTKIDSLIFVKVNQYRVENGLCELRWSNEAYNVAKNQSEYCVRLKDINHEQLDSVGSDFSIEPTFKKRFNNGGIKTDGDDWLIAENLFVIVDTNSNRIDSLEYIANETLISWKNSPIHNEVMLIENINFASVANSIGKSRKKTIFDFDTMSYYVSILNGKTYFISLEVYK